MTPEEQLRVLELVKEIETEKNPDKFVALVNELNNLLNRKKQRIMPATGKSSSTLP